MWFKMLTGFEEKTAENVRKNLMVKDNYFVSKINQRKLHFGQLEICTLEHLKLTSPTIAQSANKISVSEIVADVQQLHLQKGNKNALFQAASQFNLLEMISPNTTPEQGIDGYEKDYTQGPACAIACGAGTMYRNYFVKINAQIGQTANQQIDCLELIGEALGNEKQQLWTMQNGYALPSKSGLSIINKKLKALNSNEREQLKGKLKVGIQWDTEVTISDNKQRVSQIYCSALPVAYSTIPPFEWAAFARIILEATYEATLYAALINLKKYNSNKVFLTLVGGGAFGNKPNWILESIQKTIQKFKHTALDIKIVSYGNSNTQLQQFISQIQ